MPIAEDRGHWVCFVVDLKNYQMCYYDSLALDIPEEVYKIMPMIIEKIKPNFYMRLKYNLQKK